MIENRYYGFVSSETPTYSYMFKYKSTINNTMIYCYYYIINNRFINKECYLTDIYRIFTEIPLEKIVNYLPNNHPDKILFRKERIKSLLHES